MEGTLSDLSFPLYLTTIGFIFAISHILHTILLYPLVLLNSQHLTTLYYIQTYDSKQSGRTSNPTVHKTTLQNSIKKLNVFYNFVFNHTKLAPSFAKVSYLWLTTLLCIWLLTKRYASYKVQIFYLYVRVSF